MKKNNSLYLLFLAIITVCAIASSTISAIAYGSFAVFEIFYFICIALSFLTLSQAEHIKGHLFAGIVLYALGFMINSFCWTLEMTAGVGRALNVIQTALIFISAVIFIHACLSPQAARIINLFASALLGIFIIIVAVYNVIAGLGTSNGILLKATVIIQNISLLSTTLLPASQILYIKNKE